MFCCYENAVMITHDPVKQIQSESMLVVEAKFYAEYQNGSYWIASTQISLDSIVYAFCNGLSAESIVQSFPLLTLEQVYGAIVFYRPNRTDVDSYLAEEEVAFDAMPQPLQATDPALFRKLLSAKADRHKSGTWLFATKQMLI